MTFYDSWSRDVDCIDHKLVWPVVGKYKKKLQG